MSQSVIQINNLYKQYKNTETFVVKGVSLAIAQKEIFGLLGPNGAGKTTLLSMMCGLLKPTSGYISILDKYYSNHKTEINQNIGVVSQEYALHPTITATGDIAYFACMYGMKGRN